MQSTVIDEVNAISSSINKSSESPQYSIFSNYMNSNEVTSTCNENLESLTDASSTFAKAMFGILAFLNTFTIIYLIYNIFQLNGSKRCKNSSLVCFYIGSTVTLLCLQVYFLAFLLNLPSCYYIFFMSFPCYAMLCTAFCYISHVLKLVLTQYPRIRRSKKCKVYVTRTIQLLALLIILGILTFYLTNVIKACQNTKGNYFQPMSIAALNYITFLCICGANYLQYRFLQERYNGTSSQKNKLGLITLAFSISFLYRGIYDTVQFAIGDKWAIFQCENEIGWGLSLFFLHLVGEIVPFTLIFWLHDTANNVNGTLMERLLGKKKKSSSISGLNGGSNENTLKLINATTMSSNSKALVNDSGKNQQCDLMFEEQASIESIRVDNERDKYSYVDGRSSIPKTDRRSNLKFSGVSQDYSSNKQTLTPLNHSTMSNYERDLEFPRAKVSNDMIKLSKVEISDQDFRSNNNRSSLATYNRMFNSNEFEETKDDSKPK